MNAQDTILRACQHERKPCEVNMGNGEVVFTCGDCYNASVYARRAERKVQLAKHWDAYRCAQQEAMREAGASIGQRVSYFCPSMLGLGGVTVTGQIRANRNGIAVIRLDQIVDGKREASWNKGWKEIRA
jgi:hypothetical protein